jgi:hypothetical protein
MTNKPPKNVKGRMAKGKTRILRKQICEKRMAADLGNRPIY